ncbi:hypothetical protein CLAFUW4_09658 [Fulvia fulva]|uniref:RGS domain-containing protein n=1 Tax=Passalora fulva TaxID=5499 RepID=A0A9Q8PGH1_PASFU|nr:uncharacterized protein CLAFUR5_09752 [Fulvia fulva]KAK4613617.1 hypothetical protein CLAFUR4_09663 [Fulvia fulva]KAK4615159.1 hypothetical protein CLAFUR0_09654 [Fulvia fulva]UJO22065.1 hypothetical protein CLAFUR5_09752 [Fulvia fulva]WPV19997.1 hypothetical protein CLAFUW4_09658 [Fulvia fulva]WPV35632.1 hypothetical protein CLAFUW7_09659 [Fulvia fulva]
MGLEPLGRNWGDIVNWDDLAKAYAGFIIAWTILLYVGVGWIVYNRHLPSVRIRNVSIAVLSVSFLHLYLVKIVLAYTTNGHFLCGAEFWIMSIYLPFGIALFQMNLVQLHSIAEQQRKLLSSAGSMRSIPTGTPKTVRGAWVYWKGLSSSTRSYIYIGLGMLVQLIITAVLYATTPELQGDWTSYGKVTHAKGQALCRKSLVWIPSAFWQLFWTWVFGLYTLYKIRNIRDTHYWRLGTWLSVIFGLPGTPLWIAAVFCIKFKPVNIRWVPPMWLAPGIVVMQIVTIFFPMLEEYQSRRHMRRTLSIIETWEKKDTADLYGSIVSGDRSQLSQSTSTRSKELYSMASLEKALAVNPLPLLHFAANKDFTAENIIFLMRVKEWRQAWASAPRQPGSRSVTEESRAMLFRLAVEIYMTCVLDTISEFPINIEGPVRTKLDFLFDSAVPDGKKRTSAESDASPFGFEMDDPKNGPIATEVKRIALVREGSADSDDTLWSDASSKGRSLNSANGVVTYHPDTDPIFDPHPAHSPLGSARAKIKPEFDHMAFDAAEASIKYLVLTNTWRKFAQKAQHGAVEIV